MTSYPANMTAQDGYRYGVRFGDGSVAEWWNGRTQRSRAAELAAEVAREFAPDRAVVVRRSSPDDPWAPAPPPGDVEAWVVDALASAPPLAPEQRARLARLLSAPLSPDPDSARAPAQRERDSGSAGHTGPRSGDDEHPA